MEFDAVLLSRLQFAFTIAFHILFPTLTIGLGAFLVLIEGLVRDSYTWALVDELSAHLAGGLVADGSGHPSVDKQGSGGN